MRKRFVSLLGLLGMPLLLWSAELWRTKPVREWTREETQQFLRNSPWVRAISSGGSLLDTSAPGEAVETQAGRRESSAAAERTAPSEMSVGGAGGRGGTTYYVEWSSAKIVRQASLHSGALQGRAKEEGAEPPPVAFYVLSVLGPDLRAFAGFTEVQLKSVAYLRPKRAKTKVEPAEVKVRKTQDQRIASVHFLFPRELGGQPVIAEQEKSVEFSCKVKDLTLKTSFDLGKMITEQGRDL